MCAGLVSSLPNAFSHFSCGRHLYYRLALQRVMDETGGETGSQMADSAEADGAEGLSNQNPTPTAEEHV